MKNDPNQGSWTAEQPAFPPNWSGAVNSGLLQSVSCPTADSCTAVGYYDDSAQMSYGLIDTLQGGVWVPSAAPLPAGGSSGSLSQVTCPAAGSCVAIGSYYDPNVDLDGLIEVLSNGVWTTMQAPNPPGVPAGQYGVFLTGLSCPAVGFCTITGEYTHGEPHQVQLFVDTLSGGSWTASDVPLPSNAGPAYFESDTLESVDCPSAGWCDASGAYLDTTGQHDGLLENLSDGIWTATEAPAPTATASDEEVNVDLSNIACPVAGSCEAIGTYNDLTQPPGQPYTSTPVQGILETLSDGTWSDISALPLPADADPTETSALSAITCPAAGSCEGVGDYTVSGDSGDVSALVESQSGETWTPTPLPLPTNANTIGVSFLRALSCPVTGSCLAVGNYTADDGTTQVLTEVLADGSWAATEGPLPADADVSQQELQLGAVSCSTPDTCTAVGQYSVVVTSGYNKGHPGPMGLVETFGFPLAPSISSADQTTFTAGQGGSFTVMATGYPLPAIAEKGKLPKGLSFTAGNGHATISGVAKKSKKVHTYVIKIQASNSVKKNVTQSLSLTVSP